MRTDPFRELDRMAQRLAGDSRYASAMPMDAYREGDTDEREANLGGAPRLSGRRAPAGHREVTVARSPAGRVSRGVMVPVGTRSRGRPDLRTQEAP
jgi:HSP20 family protein